MHEHISTLTTFLSVQLCVPSGGGDKQEGSDLHLSVRESGFSGHPANQTVLQGTCACWQGFVREGLTPGMQPELSHCTNSFILALSGLVYMPLHPATAQLLENFPSKSYREKGLKKLSRDACTSSAGRDTKQGGVTDAFPQRSAGNW